MLKKRIIFTLLYCDGHFVQSRNFNLQKVGDVSWLEKNYDFTEQIQTICEGAEQRTNNTQDGDNE